MEIFFAVHDCATLKGSWSTEVSRSVLKSFSRSLIHAVRMCQCDQSESFEAKEAATAQEKKETAAAAWTPQFYQKWRAKDVTKGFSLQLTPFDGSLIKHSGASRGGGAHQVSPVATMASLGPLPTGSTGN